MVEGISNFEYQVPSILTLKYPQLLEQAGTYLPQSYLIHEEMVVTDYIENVDELGFFIARLCHGKKSFKLQRRDLAKGNLIYFVQF